MRNWLEPGRLVTLYAVLVIGSVAFALARLTWHVAGYSGIATPPPDSPAAPAVNRRAPDLAAITRLAPFGRSDPNAAPPTRLPLQLRGVIVATPAGASSAWIAQGGGTVRSFAVGETVMAGATLKHVGADHVLLEVGGHAERLAFPRKDESAPSRTADSPPAEAETPNRD